MNIPYRSCANYMCSVYGCQGHCRWPPQPAYFTQAAPIGCICPPTSEQTCGHPICPRRKPSWHSAIASVDTHPKGGDVEQAPLVSGAVAESETPE